MKFVSIQFIIVISLVKLEFLELRTWNDEYYNIQLTKDIPGKSKNILGTIFRRYLPLICQLNGGGKVIYVYK